MKTITINGFIHAKAARSWEEEQGNYADGHTFQWWAWADMDGYKNVMPMALTFEIPDNFTTAPEEIAALEKHRAEVLADAQVKVNHINDQISKLQALTFDGVEA